MLAMSTQPTGCIQARWQSIRSRAPPAKNAMPTWLAATAAPAAARTRVVDRWRSLVVPHVVGRETARPAYDGRQRCRGD